MKLCQEDKMKVETSEVKIEDDEKVHEEENVNEEESDQPNVDECRCKMYIYYEKKVRRR